MTGQELAHISEAHARGTLAGDGKYTKLCQQWLEFQCQTPKALLTHSCTAALEMAALLLGIQPGDEVVMPSYTFVSTANAFVLRGGVPVFVDVRRDTLNLDETLVEQAITPRTKAIVPVHYAGVSCEMDAIVEIARRHDIAVVEDAAQGLMAAFKGRPLGSIGEIGALSFHETKNVISGEGGAILVNVPDLVEPAEVFREKGTNRSRFFRGEVDKYTWQSVGSSFLPGEMTAAFLYAQLEQAEAITVRRLAIWDTYWGLVEPLERVGLVRRPVIPAHCTHNGHMFYVLVDQSIDRQVLLQHMKAEGIGAVFHYVPLHSSAAGMTFGRASGSCPVTEDIADRIVRLPFWVGISQAEQTRVVEVLQAGLHIARR